MSDPIKDAGVEPGYLDTVCVRVKRILLADPIMVALFGGTINRVNFFGPLKSVPRPGLAIGPRSLFPQNEPGKTRLELTIGLLGSFLVPDRVIEDDTVPSAAGVMDVITQILSRDENRLLQEPGFPGEFIVPDGPSFATFDISDPASAGTEVERDILLEASWPAEVDMYLSIPQMIL